MKKYLLLIILILPFTVFAQGYEIVSGDLNTVGSVVKIADEEFYVIGKEDDTHIKLFAKYNLAIGAGYDNPAYRQDPDSETFYWDNTLSPNSYVANGETIDYFKGGVNAFESQYWWDSVEDKMKEKYGEPYVYINDSYHEELVYVYDENSLLKEDIDKYTDYLNTTACVKTEGRLIDAKELISLGCRTDCYACDYYVMDCDEASPDWTHNTQYWLGSVANATSPFNYFTSGLAYLANFRHVWRENVYISNNIRITDYSSNTAGLRPVIVLDTSVENSCPVEEEVKPEVKGVEEIEENPKTGITKYGLLVLLLLGISIVIYNFNKNKTLFNKE